MAWAIDALRPARPYEFPDAVDRHVVPAIRSIDLTDLREALQLGFADFTACRTDAIMLCVMYPVAGLLLSRLVIGYDVLPLVFPLVAGFALLGPLLATGLYEMSRQRERGVDAGWSAAFAAFRSPAIGSMVTLGLGLLAIFTLWLVSAALIYQATVGPLAPASAGAFVHDVFETRPGFMLMLVGIDVGALFAGLVLAISVVSFPLLLDRNVGIGVAVKTSLRAVCANPFPVAIWGLIVATGLVLGSLPFLIGLAIVMPVLGHATWHLYRRLVSI